MGAYYKDIFFSDSQNTFEYTILDKILRTEDYRGFNLDEFILKCRGDSEPIRIDEYLEYNDWSAKEAAFYINGFDYKEGDYRFPDLLHAIHLDASLTEKAVWNHRRLDGLGCEDIGLLHLALESVGYEYASELAAKFHVIFHSSFIKWKKLYSLFSHHRDLKMHAKAKQYIEYSIEAGITIPWLEYATNKDDLRQFLPQKLFNISKNELRMRVIKELLDKEGYSYEQGKYSSSRKCFWNRLHNIDSELFELADDEGIFSQICPTGHRVLNLAVNRKIVVFS